MKAIRSDESIWRIERSIPKAGNWETTDVYNQTGWLDAWELFFLEVANEREACRYSMVSIETGEQFCECEIGL